MLQKLGFNKTLLLSFQNTIFLTIFFLFRFGFRFLVGRFRFRISSSWGRGGRGGWRGCTGWLGWRLWGSCSRFLRFGFLRIWRLFSLYCRSSSSLRWRRWWLRCSSLFFRFQFGLWRGVTPFDRGCGFGNGLFCVGSGLLFIRFLSNKKRNLEKWIQEYCNFLKYWK